MSDVFGRRRRLPPIAFAVLIILISGTPAHPQEADPEILERIQTLESRLEKLDAEANELRQALGALRAEIVPESVEDLIEIEPQPEEIADLGDIEPLPEPEETPATPSPPSSSLTSSIFNPQIAVIGNFLGHLGDEIEGHGHDQGNEQEEEHGGVESMAFDEAEISLEAYIDPYARGKLFIGFSEHGAELEEGWAEFIALPWDLTAKVGKLRASFGRFNQEHFHTWPWVDAPLVMETYFGDHGLIDSGISVRKIFPNDAGVFVEATGEVYRGDAEGVFESIESSDLFYLGHLKLYRDLSDSSNIEIGGSLAQGTQPEVGGDSTFTGLDLTYRWKPLRRAIYQSLIARTEIVSSSRDGIEDDAMGFYASADYQFARRWHAGFRVDRVEHIDDPSEADESGSLVLTFVPSEFSLIRGQYRRTELADGDEADEILLQLQFSIGAHGGHPF